MKIKAIQVLLNAEQSNRTNFHRMDSHLTLLLQTIKSCDVQPKNPELNEAFAGLVADAKKFMDTNPKWDNAEVELS